MSSVKEKHVSKIVVTAIYVQDLEKSEAFYKDILGLEFVARQPDRHVFLRAGRSMLLIFNPKPHYQKPTFQPTEQQESYTSPSK